jgi:predicted MFS family arabinose efflux permease
MQSSEPAPLSARQRAIILLIAAVQFINILDFVVVMPMGPDFAKALSIPESQLGYVSGSYTAAACIAGLLGAFFLDRFDRRKALAVALGGLVIGTAFGGLATGLPTLLLARVIAGAFGGPATSLAFSIIADTIPSSHRGRAMGTVMGAFSVASVLGVPAGLLLAERFSWRAPFFTVAALGVVVGVTAIAFLPPLRGHLERPHSAVTAVELVSRPLVQLSYLMTAIVMMAGFVVIPNIAAYVQLNLGLPRAYLKHAYGVGGVASFVATQLGGRLVDRFGSFRVGAVGTALVVATVFTAFYLHWSFVPPFAVVLGFVAFMLANGLRNVSYNTLTTKVPEPEVRARFQSLQSAVQHGSSAAAAFLSSQLLTNAPGAALDGMPRVALVSMCLSLLIPVMLFIVERRVRGEALRPTAVRA